MIGSLKFVSATDKDIFDLLISSKQRLTEKNLSEMFIGRGLIMSRETDRFALCETISQMPHDRKSLLYMIEMREAASRLEKRAFTELAIALTSSEIDAAVNAYSRAPGIADKITVQWRRAKGAFFNVEYDETDYSKTRLMQTQKRDAGIEITSENGITTIRMPSTDKADDIVAGIVTEIEKIKLQKVEQGNISLSGMSAQARTEFFIRLIRGIPGYRLISVVSMKVASELPVDELTADLDIETDGDVGQEFLSKVNKVAMSGHNLLQTEEYQTLLRNGFFLTAVSWRAEQIERPNDVLQFDISFKNGSEGTGYRFNAKIAKRLVRTAEITSTFLPIAENRRPAIWNLIESASKEIAGAVRDEFTQVGS